MTARTIFATLFLIASLLLAVTEALGRGAAGQADASPAAPLVDCTWTGGAGDWETASNWSCGVVPGPDDTATINDLSAEVTLNSDAEVATLNLDSGTLTGSGTLTVTETMAWNGGTMDGTGTTVIASATTLDIVGIASRTLGRTLDNFGTAIVGGAGSVGSQGNAEFNNMAGATFIFESDEIFGTFGDDANFNNDGLVQKTAGSGTVTFEIIFNNNGTVEVLDGTLRLRNGGAGSGNFIANGTTLDFGHQWGVPYTVEAGGSISATNVLFSNGTTTVNGDYSASHTTVHNGAVHFNTPATLPNVTHSASSLAGSATITVTAEYNWSGGPMDGTGRTVIASGAALNITGSGANKVLQRNLDNEGTITFGGASRVFTNLGAQFTFNNQAGATLIFENDEFFGSANSDEAIFNNEGLVRKAAGGGVSSIGMVFNNHGAVEVLTGTLQLATGGASSGDFIANGTTLDFHPNARTYILEAGSTVSATNVLFTAGTTTVLGDYSATDTTVNGNEVNFDDATSAVFGNLTHNNDTLSMSNPAITVSGDFTRTAGIFNAGDGAITFNGGVTQTLALDVATNFHNLTVMTDTLLVESVAADNATVDGALTNYGTVRKSQSIAGTGVTTFGLTGVELDVTTQGTLAEVLVDRKGGNHPDANDQTGTGQYWTIEPVGTDYTLDLTLPHNVTPDTNALACRYTGAEWDCARDSSTLSTVTRLNVTQLSDWTVGDLEPNVVEHALAVTLAGDGSGTVTSNPAGIDCGADCTESYQEGITVTLTATPAPGSTFTGWSGACTGTAGCTVTMDSDRSVTATFDPESSDLPYSLFLPVLMKP